jgi:hypothetical protein
MSRVTAITPTIPGREAMLAEAVASVNAQTVPVHSHLIRCQRPFGRGIVHVCHQFNALLAAVETEWFATLGDDDLWLPRHVETAEPHLDDADVVTTWGVNAPGGIRTNVSGWSREQFAAQFEFANFIPAIAFIRTSAVREVGGWPTEWEGGHRDQGGHFAGSAAWAEDWELWRRLAANGARFRCVEVETWVCRPGNWPRLSTTL